MNSVYYFEIQAADPEKAAAFYTAVFAWEFTKQADMPVDYWAIDTEGINGGLLRRPAPAPAPGSGTNAYVCSMEVEDFDATAEKIVQQGGRVALPKFAIPGKCWQGYFVDPEGNTFGVFQVDEKAA